MAVPGAMGQHRKLVLGQPWDLQSHWPSFHDFGAQLFLSPSKGPSRALCFLPFLTASEGSG